MPPCRSPSTVPAPSRMSFRKASATQGPCERTAPESSGAGAASRWTTPANGLASTVRPKAKWRRPTSPGRGAVPADRGLGPGARARPTWPTATCSPGSRQHRRRRGGRARATYCRPSAQALRRRRPRRPVPRADEGQRVALLARAYAADFPHGVHCHQAARALEGPPCARRRASPSSPAVIATCSTATAPTVPPDRSRRPCPMGQVLHRGPASSRWA